MRAGFVEVSLGTVPLFNQLSTFEVLLEAVAGEDLDVVVTVGANNDPDALTGVPANVHVHQWLPLAPLLEHADAVRDAVRALVAAPTAGGR